MNQKTVMVAGGVVIAGLAVALVWSLTRTPSAPSAPTTTTPPSAPTTTAPPSAPTTTTPPSAPATTPPTPDESKASATEARLLKVKGGLDAWLQKHMSYPELIELLVRDDYLLPRDFDDAWGRRVDYQRLDEMHYRLCSRGPDNLPKTEDDVCVGGRP